MGLVIPVIPSLPISMPVAMLSPGYHATLGIIVEGLGINSAQGVPYGYFAGTQRVAIATDC